MKRQFIARFLGSDAALCTEVGRREGQALASTGQAGYLLYGPYMALEPGSYRVELYGSADAAAIADAAADVCMDVGQRIIPGPKLRATTGGQEGLLAAITYVVEENCRDIEVRVRVTERCRISIGLVEFYKISSNLISQYNESLWSTEMDAKNITLCFIVKNEGRHAIDMMESVRKLISFVSFVDTGSTDDSVNLIEEFLAKNNIPYAHREIEFINFSDARNKAIEMVPEHGDYLLILDCDEAILHDQHHLLLRLIDDDLFGYDGCYLPRWNFRNNDDPLLYPDLQLRLLKNKGFRYAGEIHEMPQGGSWLMPDSDKLEFFAHISHYKYINKTSSEIREREAQYQAIYRKTALAHKKCILEKLQTVIDPFLSLEIKNAPIEVQGWNWDHFYFREAIQKYRPKLIANVGNWKGASTIFLAQQLLNLGLDSTIVAIDTWLGNFDHLLSCDWSSCLYDNLGIPILYKQFLENINRRELTEWVLPVPMDPHNSAIFFQYNKVSFDLIHLDFSHDYYGTLRDLSDWWPLLNQEGELIGNNYYEDNSTWPEIKRAFDDFFKRQIECHSGKCRVIKLNAHSQ